MKEMTNDRMANDELPEGWVEAPFSAVTVDPVQRVPAGDEEITYIDIGSVDRVTKTISQPQTMVGKDAPSRARKVIKTGDVLVSTVRPNLNAVALVDRRFEGQFASTGFDVLRSPVLDPRWVFFSVRTPAFVERMTELVQGALYPAVRSKDVRAFTIPIAPIAEQKRIADKLEAVLERVDACRARLDRVPDLLKRFRQSVLAAATSGQLTEDWRGNESNYTQTEVELPYSHTIKGPAAWSLRTFGDVCDLIGGSQPPKATFVSEESSSVVRLIQIRDYKSDKHKIFIPRKLARRFCTKSDVMIGRYGPPIFQILRGLEGAYNVALMKAEPKTPQLDLDYLYYWLKQDVLLRYIEAGSDRTAGQDGIRKELVESYPIFLPPLAEQAEIVRRVEALFALADRIEARLATAQRLVERLTPATLSKAFRGDLVPQDPNDEPACELLKRLSVSTEIKSKRAKSN